MKMTMMPTATVNGQDNLLDPSTQLRLILIMKRIFIRIQIYLSEDTKNKTTICFYLSEREFNSQSVLKVFCYLLVSSRCCVLLRRGR